MDPIVWLIVINAALLVVVIIGGFYFRNFLYKNFREIRKLHEQQVSTLEASRDHWKDLAMEDVIEGLKKARKFANEQYKEKQKLEQTATQTTEESAAAYYDGLKMAIMDEMAVISIILERLVKVSEVPFKEIPESIGKLGFILIAILKDTTARFEEIKKSKPVEFPYTVQLLLEISDGVLEKLDPETRKMVETLRKSKEAKKA